MRMGPPDASAVTEIAQAPRAERKILLPNSCRVRYPGAVIRPRRSPHAHLAAIPVATCISEYLQVSPRPSPDVVTTRTGVCRSVRGMQAFSNANQKHLCLLLSSTAGLWLALILHDYGPLSL